MADVLALVPYRLGTACGQRTSIECWAQVLSKHGINVDFAPFESDRLSAVWYQPGRRRKKGVELIRAYIQRINHLRRVNFYDAVFVHREAALIGPELLESWVAHKGLPIIYGLDDPLFVPYRSPSNGAWSALKFPGKVARLCRMARMVIVNGEPLRSFAAKHNPSVRVVPSLVDESEYKPITRPAANPPRLGWTGSYSSATNLDLLVEPLARLSAAATFDLQIVGADRTSIGNVRCSSTRWSAATEVQELRRFDVGLLPLRDHPWNRWKFNYKLAQYMALGIPPVCTPAGCNNQIIEAGVNGFLAATSDEWVLYLRMLLTDEDLRIRIGNEAAKYAGAHFTVKANEETIVTAFESALRNSVRTG